MIEELGIAELEEIRKRLRAFIAEHRPSVRLPRGHRAPEEDQLHALRSWFAALYSAGFLGQDWPAEWGGTNGTHPLASAVVIEELAHADLPDRIGAGYLASRALYTFGSEEQKRRYLPRIRSSEDLWCQLFSEPDAGSDLVSLRCRADLDGDDYVVSGQKIWTTNAQHADLGLLLARTDLEARPRSGISAFVVDMRSPGIDCRPLREITGTSDFNEVFLDDVRVPSRNVIGDVNAGWEIATHCLSHERATNAGLPIRLQQLFQELVDDIKDSSEAVRNPRVRQRLALYYSKVRICGLLSLATLSRAAGGHESRSDAPVNKLFSSELNLAMTEFGVSRAGMAAVASSCHGGDERYARWSDDFLYARAYTIAGGTNEIMRNILAERVLGLPRDPSASKS